MAKGWHSPTDSRTQQVHSSLDVHIHDHVLSRHTQRVYRSAGRELEHHASRYTCGFLSGVPKREEVRGTKKKRDAPRRKERDVPKTEAKREVPQTKIKERGVKDKNTNRKVTKTKSKEKKRDVPNKKKRSPEKTKQK